MEQEKFTKKERREIEREEEKKRVEKENINKKIRNYFIIALVLLLTGGGLWWIVKESSKPLPGKSVEEQGRQHVTRSEWEKYKYNSNPPTSGPHDSNPLGSGVYDTPQGDGNLVHSLEHGYVVISYDCTKLNSKIKSQNSKLIKTAFAHEEGDTLTPEEHAASESAKLEGDAWKSKACTDLKKELKEIAEEQKLWKLIVVPRPNLDTPIALTAWTRIDKIEKLDKDRMRLFVNSFRDHGPEQTAD